MTLRGTIQTLTVQTLPFKPRCRIHPQNPDTVEGIGECFPFFQCSAVVLRKHQPPLMHFRLCSPNAFFYLRPIGFEDSRRVKIVPAIVGCQFDLALRLKKTEASTRFSAVRHCPVPLSCKL